jgi:Family of unknown function (DUF5372)
VVLCSRTLSRELCFNDLSTAPQVREESRQVRITHPFHPLRGKQFELIEHRCIFAESYVYFHDEDGQLREVPAVWTDFVPQDVFVERAAGRSPLHAGSLWALTRLLEHLTQELGHEM